MSFGPRGAIYTVSPRGNRATLGLPGTGLFYTIQDRKGARAATPTRDKLSLGFFRRLVTPTEEKALVDGLRALNGGDEDEALSQLEAASDLPDAAWMAGMMRLKREAFEQARGHLESALAAGDRLGALFLKYDLAPQSTLPIAKGIFAHISPTERGTRLALVELCEASGDSEGAAQHLEPLMAIAPEDPVVLLSFVQIALDTPQDHNLMDRVIDLTIATQNESPVDTGILLDRARALAARGLPDAAIEVLTRAGRRRKDRPDRLLHQIRHDRAELYERVGRKAQARREFEKLYAEVPEFEGLAARLGLM
jgi:tetratricopeptide (TPR) repeat protein